MFKRTLGCSRIQVSALGLGCWAIGGPFWRNGVPVGWGKVDDTESIRAIHRALDLGINFFDTADVYGCGHSERVLGQALARRRERVRIATKFGQVFIEETRQAIGYDTSPEHIRRACEASLRRLGTDYMDLYQLHVQEVDTAQALLVRETLEALVAEARSAFTAGALIARRAPASLQRGLIARPFSNSSTSLMETPTRWPFVSTLIWQVSTAAPWGWDYSLENSWSTRRCPRMMSAAAGRSFRQSARLDWPNWSRSGPCSRRAGAPWRKAHWAGYGRAASRPSQSSGSKRLPELRKMWLHCASARWPMSK